MIKQRKINSFAGGKLFLYIKRGCLIQRIKIFYNPWESSMMSGSQLPRRWFLDVKFLSSRFVRGNDSIPTFSRATFRSFHVLEDSGLSWSWSATKGQRLLLFFTDFCFACCALLFYFLFLFLGKRRVKKLWKIRKR